MNKEKLFIIWVVETKNLIHYIKKGNKVVDLFKRNNNLKYHKKKLHNIFKIPWLRRVSRC